MTMLRKHGYRPSNHIPILSLYCTRPRPDCLTATPSDTMAASHVPTGLLGKRKAPTPDSDPDQALVQMYATHAKRRCLEERIRIAEQEHKTTLSTLRHQFADVLREDTLPPDVTYAAWPEGLATRPFDFEAETACVKHKKSRRYCNWDKRGTGTYQQAFAVLRNGPLLRSRDATLVQHMVTFYLIGNHQSTDQVAQANAALSLLGVDATFHVFTQCEGPSACEGSFTPGMESDTMEREEGNWAVHNPEHDHLEEVMDAVLKYALEHRLVPLGPRDADPGTDAGYTRFADKFCSKHPSADVFACARAWDQLDDATKQTWVNGS